MTMTLTAAGTIAGVAASASTVTYTIFGDEVGTADSFKKLAQGQLPAAAATVYTVPGATQSIVKTIVLDNNGVTAQLVSMYIDGTAATNRIGSFTIPAGGNATWTAAGWAMHDTTGALLGTTALPPQANNTFTGNISGGVAPPVGLTQAQATALLNLATSTLQGAMSAAQFKKLLGYQDLVADWGFVGDDATDNLAAWNTMVAGVANNQILYCPMGTFRFSNEATLNQDKHLNFHGSGERTSVWKTTSATANLLNITGSGGNAWYNTFSDLGFSSSVTKTAGAMIGINVATAIGIDIDRVAIDNHFIGIDAQGAQAGNVSVWNNLAISAPAVNGRGIRINGSVINLVIQNSTINGVPNAGAIAGSANIEINQSGAVQVGFCDLIGAVNSVLLNANQGGGTSIAACYFTNTFFDQSGGSTVKVTGANTTNRIKFSQCGIAAGVIGQCAFEVNGTGSGAVGTATAMPAGISLIDCDIYYAPGGNTTAGIKVNGCQDINIQNTRVAGFSGVGGVGIWVIPSSLNQTRVRINGCRIGPNSNLTINNTVGVQLDVGSSGIGALSITDNDIVGNGTPIIDNSTMSVGGSKIINNNAGAAAGLSAIATSGTTITTGATDTAVPGMQIYLPANAIKANTTIRWSRMDTVSATSTTIETMHVGTAGTTADATKISATSAASGAAATVLIEGWITFNSVGATAAFVGGIRVTQAALASALIVATVTGTVNTTVANYLTNSVSNGTANTRTIRSGTMEILSPV